MRVVVVECRVYRTLDQLAPVVESHIHTGLDVVHRDEFLRLLVRLHESRLDRAERGATEHRLQVVGRDRHGVGRNPDREPTVLVRRDDRHGRRLGLELDRSVRAVDDVVLVVVHHTERLPGHEVLGGGRVVTVLDARRLGVVVRVAGVGPVGTELDGHDAGLGQVHVNDDTLDPRHLVALEQGGDDHTGPNQLGLDRVVLVDQFHNFSRG